jgi:hypothetical protein
MAPIIAFALAALIGVTMAVRHFSGKETPVLVGLIHGAFAATGLVLLIIAVMNAPAAGLGGIALAVLAGAAIGGFILLSHQLRGQRWPNAYVLAHGAIAATGVVLAALWLL